MYSLKYGKIPDSWINGRISGMKLPGGHDIFVKWENGKARAVEL